LKRYHGSRSRRSAASDSNGHSEGSFLGAWLVAAYVNDWTLRYWEHFGHTAAVATAIVLVPCASARSPPAGPGGRSRPGRPAWWRRRWRWPARSRCWPC